MNACTMHAISIFYQLSHKSHTVVYTNKYSSGFACKHRSILGNVLVTVRIVDGLRSAGFCQITARGLTIRVIACIGCVVEMAQFVNESTLSNMISVSESNSC
jgi:hypothetical protein